MEAKQKNGNDAAVPQTPDLHQVREILVGPLTKDLAGRMDRLETRLDQSLNDLTEQLSGRIRKLEDQVSKEMVRLRSGVEEQCESNTTRIKQIQDDHKSALLELQKNAKRLAEGMSSVHQGIRSEVNREIESVLERIEQFTGDVGARMVERQALAGILSEFAERVGRAPAQPK